MTFLEFVDRRLMGPPPLHCPFHDDAHPSFSIRPPKGKYPIKYKCWGCGAWGDEHDLLRPFDPRDNYQQRLQRIAELREEFEQGEPAVMVPVYVQDKQAEDTIGLAEMMLADDMGPIVGKHTLEDALRWLSWWRIVASAFGASMDALTQAAQHKLREPKEDDRLVNALRGARNVKAPNGRTG